MTISKAEQLKNLKVLRSQFTSIPRSSVHHFTIGSTVVCGADPCPPLP